MASRLGESVRQLRADGPSAGLSPEVIESSIASALQHALDEQEPLRQQIARIFDAVGEVS